MRRRCVQENDKKRKTRGKKEGEWVAETDGRSMTPQGMPRVYFRPQTHYRSRKIPSPRSTRCYFRPTAGVRCTRRPPSKLYHTSCQPYTLPMPLVGGAHTTDLNQHHITLDNQSNDAAAVSGPPRERKTKITLSINPMFRKYARSKSPFPPLVSDPIMGDPGTTEGLGLGVGCSGGAPWQALTVGQKRETSAMTHLEGQAKSLTFAPGSTRIVDWLGVRPPLSFPNVPWLLQIQSLLNKNRADPHSPVVRNLLSANVRFTLHIPIGRAIARCESITPRHPQCLLDRLGAFPVRCTVPSR